MPYTPPLIKPLIPPLRPSAPFPFRTPGINRPPQIAPIYQPPDLVPPTGLDLKGVICIYSNPPIWEPKKIRYRYPGENWQEIAGERYTTKIVSTPPSYFSNWLIFDMVLTVKAWSGWSPGIYKVFFPNITVTGTLLSIDSSYPIGSVWGGNLYWYAQYIMAQNPNAIQTITSVHPGHFNLVSSAYNEIIGFNYKLKDLNVNKEVPLFDQCEFKVFNIFNQEILSITRNTCPEVLIIPERCYFQPENEKLARKVNLSPNMDLRVEYSGNCATVWMDLWPLNYFPVQVYKECSDNPNCPPPKIRFDKKCEKKEKCEQCPKGTAAKVLIGLTIACVDKNGCIKKIIKYKPGCNTYDCVC